MSHSLLDTLTLRGLFIGQFYLITTDVSRNSAAGAAAQSGYFDQRHAEDTVRLLFFLSTEEVQGSEEAHFNCDCRFPLLGLTSAMGISSGPGPGWLGPLASMRFGCSAH